MAMKKKEARKKTWASSKRNMAKFELAYRKVINPTKDEEE